MMAVATWLPVLAGAAELDDDIRRYVPQFNAGNRTIAIQQLLNHTSGIPDYISQPAFRTAGYSRTNASPEQILELIDGVPFHFEPGEAWAYSNTGYLLLGMLADRVTHELLTTPLVRWPVRDGE